jgi:transcriptional regulator with XRE-family HTH domain
MDYPRSRVAARIRKYRKRRGLTLHELSERTGVAASNLSAIELNKSSPTLNTLVRIAAAFNVRAGEFLDAITYPPARLIRFNDFKEADQSGSGIEDPGYDWVYPEGKLRANILELSPGESDYSFEANEQEMALCIITGALEVLVDDEIFNVDQDSCLHITRDSQIIMNNISRARTKALIISLKS